GESGSNGLVVAFERANNEEVIAAISELAPEGKLSIAQEVKGVAIDLTTGNGGAESKKTVLMILGSSEVCEKSSFKMITKTVQNNTVPINWKLLGLDIDRDCREKFESLQGWVDLAFPRNREELSWLVRDAITGQPFRNLAPEIWFDLAGDRVEIRSGEEFAITVVTRDSNGTKLVVDVVDPPDNARLEKKELGATQFIWIPDDDQEGDHVVAFTASDGEVATAAVLHLVVMEKETDIEVNKVMGKYEPVPVNHVPTIKTKEGQYSYTVTEGERLAFILVGEDPDGTEPDISISPLPNGASLTDMPAGEVEFSWTPLPGQLGTHLLTFMATDQQLKNTRNIAVTVIGAAHEDILDFPKLVLFDLDGYGLSEAGKKHLHDFVYELKESKLVKNVTITGHTCSLGSADYNIELGMERAKVVRDYLKKAGIAEELLHIKSKGENNPLANNETSTGREKNRRVHCVAEVVH
ncbi:MAG: OmpA family protein, partial [Desulfobulbaceae bacterium]|nr:OmpA family protein [Desulfobulbaceae bacterium]